MLPREIDVMGRKLKLKKTCGRLVDCTFDDLCNKVLIISGIVVQSSDPFTQKNVASVLFAI